MTAPEQEQVISRPPGATRRSARAFSCRYFTDARCSTYRTRACRSEQPCRGIMETTPCGRLVSCIMHVLLPVRAGKRTLHVRASRTQASPYQHLHLQRKPGCSLLSIASMSHTNRISPYSGSLSPICMFGGQF